MSTVIIRCLVCDEPHEYDSDKVPKAFVCRRDGCNVGQRVEQKPNVGYTPGRNVTGHILPPGRG